MKASFFVRYGLLIAAITVFFWPIVGVGALRAMRSNRNDVQDWLPAHYSETRTFKWFLSHFSGEEFILASWDGCTLDDQRIKLLIEKLMPAKPDSSKPEHYYFKDATTGEQIIQRLSNEPLSLERQQAIDSLRGTIIGKDGKTTSVMLVLSEVGKEKVRKAVVRVRDVASQECNIPLDKLHLGGPAVDNTAMDEAGEKSLMRLAAAAMGVGIAISWWCLRSGRLIAMVFFTGIYCAVLSLALVYYTGTRMNAIMMTMPSLVYVAAISAAIHLSNYYRDNAIEQGLFGAATRALKHAALPLGLATVTTAIGLVSLLTSDLIPIRLFGLYSAIGVVASLLPLCFFLPAAFELWPLKPQALSTDVKETFDAPEFSPLWSRVGEWIINRHALVTIAGVVVLALFGWGCTDTQTSTQLMRMFPEDARILKDYKWLETNLGDLVPMEIVLRFDKDKNQLSFLDRMRLVNYLEHQIKPSGNDQHEGVKNVGSTMSASTFIGPKLFQDETHARQFDPKKVLAGERERPSLVNKRGMYTNVMAKKLEKNRQQFIDLEFVADETVDIDGLPVNNELWRLSARVSALNDVKFDELQVALAQKVDDLLGDEATKAAQGISVVYTGLVPLIDKSQRSLLDGLLIGFITDLVVVTIVMVFAIREWSAGIVLLLPSIFPVVVVFGYMGFAGVIVDTGTVMAPGVALGVTIDDVVHFMLKYREGLALGLDRRKAIMLAYKGCARAMYQSWGVIGLGLSAFALSPFTPTRRFGYLMVSLLTAALIGNLVLLPAVLAGPFGSLFGRKFQRRREPEDASPATGGEHVPATPHVRPRLQEETLAK